MPVNGDVFTSYIFGAGACGLGNGGAPVPTETDRDSLQGDDILINRQHFLLHPRGVKFTDAEVVGSSPTNTELEIGRASCRERVGIWGADGSCKKKKRRNRE